jgi:hypothetical protein
MVCITEYKLRKFECSQARCCQSGRGVKHKACSTKEGESHLKSDHPLRAICSKHANTPLLLEADGAHCGTNVRSSEAGFCICDVSEWLYLSVDHVAVAKAWAIWVQLDRTLKELVAGGDIGKMRKPVLCFRTFVYWTSGRYAISCCPSRLNFDGLLGAFHLRAVTPVRRSTTGNLD